jgi:hypothetical protein
MGNDLGCGGVRLVGARLKTGVSALRFAANKTSLALPGLGIAFNQQSNQAQERLMLGISPSAQKCANHDLGQLTSG